MNEELFLIAHKVRGEAAFDVAIQMQVEDELWWIIPTSGHRAYPWAAIPLDHCIMPHNAGTRRIHISLLGEMPSDLPDHYTTRASPAERAAEGQGLLAKLGLTRKAIPFTDRRV